MLVHGWLRSFCFTESIPDLGVPGYAEAIDVVELVAHVNLFLSLTWLAIWTMRNKLWQIVLIDLSGQAVFLRMFN